MSTPKRVLKGILQPRASEVEALPLTDTRFDEEAEEWQALIFSTPYSMHSYQLLEQNIQNNFGTVDNPHVIFTSDSPYRYVGCSGLPNPDDYEGHEFVVFMLREGPLQRCPVCGQVYKLVRLRKENTQEMNYYANSLMAPELQEFINDDQWASLSPLRMMPDQYEASPFLMETSVIYRSLNPDDHDRYLVDPAFRMEIAAKTSRAHQVYEDSMDELSKHAPAFMDPFLGKAVIGKDVYEALIQAEINMRKLDRGFKKSKRFHARQFLDLENHERRERRMLERSKNRTEDAYTVYFGNMTELELKHNDYFETDLEGEDSDAFLDAVEEEYVRSLPQFQTNFYQFSENAVSRQFIADSSSVVERLAFNFRNRRSIDSVSDYQRRQTRMVSRQLERANSSERKELEQKVAGAITSGNEVSKYQQEYMDMIFGDSIQQFADYYETEGDENPQILRQGNPSIVSSLMLGYRDYSKLGNDTKGHFSIPKRQWNQALGMTQNIIEEFKDYNAYILPKLERLSNVAQANLITSRNDSYSIEDLSSKLELNDK